MKTSFLLFLAFFNLLHSSHADLGFQIGIGSPILNDDQLNCISNKDNQYLIVPAYDPSGQVDSNGIQTLTNTFDLEGLGVYPYITPCFSNCQNGLISATDQIHSALDAIVGIGGSIEFGYINVGSSQPWSSDQKKNQQFIINMFIAASKSPYYFGLGIMTSYSSWSTIVGMNFNLSSIPGSGFNITTSDLLWVNWNGVQDLTTGFMPFGGWDEPTIHQFAGGITSDSCVPGVNVAYNFFPNDGFKKINQNKKAKS